MRNKVFVQWPTDWFGIFIKSIALAVLVLATNFGFFDRIDLLYASDRWFTLVFYLGVWGASISALVIAAFQPKLTVRLAWAGLLSISAAIAFMYTYISGSALSVFDALSLWTARHETDRAFEFYQTGALYALVVFAAHFFIISAPPVPSHRWVNKGLRWLSWTPAVPVFFIAAIIFLKEGGGSQALPSQFQPLAIGFVTAKKIATLKIPERRAVRMKSGELKPVKHIVMLIDESVRSDCLNWSANNPYTPFLAQNQSNIVNFGNAVSGGNCSSYSNAILRFGARYSNVVGTIRTNPTIWQYAKKAGYRTVYIDGQSGLNKNPGLLQNFMTLDETKDIDRIVRYANVAGPQLDFELLDTIKKELQSDTPVFIFANKNGAHFPYDEGYPGSQTKFEPTIKQSSRDLMAPRINSYLNVIKWSVDRFFSRVFDELDLTDTAIIYTSDHGQNLKSGRLSHCSNTNADPREGLVPLFAITSNAALKSRFENGALLNQNRANHFSIHPTVLEIMGYEADAIRKQYGPSLFVKLNQKPKFTSGDVFGVFRKQVNWTPVDLAKNYLEIKRLPQPKPGIIASVNQ